VPVFLQGSLVTWCDVSFNGDNYKPTAECHSGRICKTGLQSAKLLARV